MNILGHYLNQWISVELNAIPMVWSQADGMAEMKQVVTEMSKLDTEVRHGVAFSTDRYG